MIKEAILTFLILLLASSLFAQEPTQTIRGVVIDNQSKTPLVGVSVVLLTSESFTGNASDLDGNFRLEKVPVGRQTLKATYVGYRERVIQVIVTSGKETIITIEMEESVVQGKEVVISAEREKTKAINEMATVSARSFTIEETSRYAGSRNDPARMAANYAGVSGANDSRNDIIIRGNSPQGVLWRLNGMDIPNPNHFGSLGSTGGPVGILNNNVLDNSDFLTGAFPSEYGNALAGVFDLRMRSGNNEKHEHMFQLGFTGFEGGIEGPFSKKSKASYLVNYRYSSLAVFQAMGANFGTGSAVPQYQDLSFKVDLPTEKAGKFSLFGVGGISYIEFLDSKKDSTAKDFYSTSGTDTYFGSNMGVVGLQHVYSFNSSTFGKLSLSASGFSTKIQQDSLSTFDRTPIAYYGNTSSNTKLSANYVLVKKFNAKNTLKTGFFVDDIMYSLKDSVFDAPVYQRLRNSSGNSFLYQAYVQWQHKFTDKITSNLGVHYQQLAINNSYAVEPRVGIKWEFKEGQSINIGAGMHSQMQSIFTYFDESYIPSTGERILTNKNLDFSRSNQLVLGYDNAFTKSMRLKAEAYYQYLYDIPVTQRKSYYSAVNAGADFNNPSIDSLVNKGTGTNFGVELTLEKFYSKGYYFLITASLFDSKYKGSDGVERNTAFNGNYTYNALAGKEFTINKKSLISIDVKVTYAGGKREVPIDLEASNLKGSVVYIESDAYETKLKDYFRSDVKLSYKRNGRRITQEFSVDIQNVSGNKNIFQRTYDPQKQDLRTEYQIGLFVIPQYRILF
ncbi:MAG: TonB-dependent receptor [Bacteroidetes bacterium]|nr:TonB-dependent receptor [Bacteroidota bacterium]